MKKTIDNISREELENIIEKSFNYERIRLWTENHLASDQKFQSISNRCRIIFNPFRSMFFIHVYDQGIEKYFDFEKEDTELTDEIAIHYKKVFIAGLNELYSNNELIIY